MKIVTTEEVRVTREMLELLLPPPTADHELSVFTGNQWNPDWGWDKSKIRKLTDEELIALYREMKRLSKERSRLWQ